MFARIMAVVLTVILLLTVVLSGIGWITLKDQQTETVMETLRTEAREIAYLAAQRTDSIDLGFFGHTRSNKNTYLQWKANEVYEDGIRVHVIAPGAVFTDMVRISRPDLSDEGMILAEDIAEVAAFFVTHRTNAVIDEIQVHRAGKAPFA